MRMSYLTIASAMLVSPLYNHAAHGQEINSAAAAPFDLVRLQDRIMLARYAASQNGDTSGLVTIVNRLRALDTAPKGQLAYYAPYWRAYTAYALAGQQLKLGKRSDAAASLDEATSALKRIAAPDAETMSLNALVVGLQLAVASPNQYAALTAEARTSLEGAKSASADNIRVLFASAVADYATPAQYGGGRLAEGLLRRALASKPEPRRALVPNWGRDDCAALLIRILAASSREAEARKLLTEYATLYPKSGPLASIATVLARPAG
jgi:hypothetical protein